MKVPTRARHDSDDGLKMAPLIDCVFLLLTYFLFTISLATIEGLLPSELALGDELQQSQLKLKEESDEVIVRVVRTGNGVQYFIDDWPLPDFSAVATRLASTPTDSTVVIDAGSTVAYRHVISLYNHCLRLGIDKVAFPISGAVGTSGAPRL